MRLSRVRSVKKALMEEGRKARKPSRGVKGMDRIMPIMYRSDNYGASIGSL